MAARTFNGRLFWRERRGEIVRRDGGRCILCGERSGLTVHHIRPQVLGRDDSPANLVTLCSAHHDGIERFGQRAGAWLIWIIGAPVFTLARYLRRSKGNQICRF